MDCFSHGKRKTALLVSLHSWWLATKTLPLASNCNFNTVKALAVSKPIQRLELWKLENRDCHQVRNPIMTGESFPSITAGESDHYA